MQVFRVSSADDPTNKTSIDATHKWGLPGVVCESCGVTWANTGTQYPSVDISDNPTESLYRLPRVLPFKLFEELRESIRASFPNDALLYPGTEFGSLVGWARDCPDGFVWQNPWTLLIHKNALNRLADNDVFLPLTVPCQLTTKAPECLELYEFEITSYACLSPGMLHGAKICFVCNRIEVKVPFEELVIEKNSVPANLDLFRVAEFTTMILATERFVEAAITSNLSGIRFDEIKLE